MAKRDKHLVLEDAQLELMEQQADETNEVDSFSQYVFYCFSEMNRLQKELNQLRESEKILQKLKYMDKDLFYLTKFTEIAMKKLALWGDEDLHQVQRNAKKEMEQVFNRLTVE